MSRPLLVQQDSGTGGSRLPDPEFQDVELREVTVEASTVGVSMAGVRTDPVPIILCLCAWILSVPRIPLTRVDSFAH